MDDVTGESEPQLAPPRDTTVGITSLVFTTIVVTLVVYFVIWLVGGTAEKYLLRYRQAGLLWLAYSLLLVVVVSIFYVWLYSAIGQWLSGHWGGNYRLGSSLYDLVSGTDEEKPIPSHILSLTATLISTITIFWVRDVAKRWGTTGTVRIAQIVVLSTLASLATIYVILLGAAIVVNRRLPIDGF